MALPIGDAQLEADSLFPRMRSAPIRHSAMCTLPQRSGAEQRSQARPSDDALQSSNGEQRKPLRRPPIGMLGHRGACAVMRESGMSGRTLVEPADW